MFDLLGVLVAPKNTSGSCLNVSGDGCIGNVRAWAKISEGFEGQFMAKTEANEISCLRCLSRVFGVDVNSATPKLYFPAPGP